ncbi:MAG: glycosyltransferase family 9 protein [bacterium]
MKDPRAICVFLAGALGDFVNALPALSLLRESYPAARIELVGNPSWLPLVAASALVDRIHSQEDLPLAAAFQRELPEAHSLARFLASFDFILSWFGDREGRWERALESACDGEIHVFPLFRYERFQGHIREYFLSSLRATGLRAIPREPFRLRLPAGGPGPGKPGGVPLGSASYLCLHPGSGSPRKNWSRQGFAALASLARPRWGLEARVVLGPAERGSEAFWRELQSPGLVVVEDPPIVELARMLSGARLYIGNDSGVTHLASCLGVPVVALFGPTDPARWGPRGAAVRILSGSACGAPIGRAAGVDWSYTEGDAAGPATAEVLEAAERLLNPPRDDSR